MVIRSNMGLSKRGEREVPGAQMKRKDGHEGTRGWVWPKRQNGGIELGDRQKVDGKEGGDDRRNVNK